MTSNGQQFALPIANTTGCYAIFANDRDYGCDRIGIVPDSANTFIVWNKNDSGQDEKAMGNVMCSIVVPVIPHC